MKTINKTPYQVSQTHIERRFANTGGVFFWRIPITDTDCNMNYFSEYFTFRGLRLTLIFKNIPDQVYDSKNFIFKVSVICVNGKKSAIDKLDISVLDKCMFKYATKKFPNVFLDDSTNNEVSGDSITFAIPKTHLESLTYDTYLLLQVDITARLYPAERRRSDYDTIDTIVDVEAMEDYCSLYLYPDDDTEDQINGKLLTSITANFFSKLFIEFYKFVKNRI